MDTNRPAAAPASPEQQKVLNRILVQRERLKARRTAYRQSRAVMASEGAGRVEPGAPVAMRMLAFARLHPLVTAAAVGVAVMAGPARLIRWAGMVMPLVVRLRRG